MCLWCGNSLIAEKLTSGFAQTAPNRRRFMAYAVSAGAAASLTASRPASAADGAEVIFKNGTIIPMAGQQRSVEALAIGGGKILAVGSAADVSALAGSGTRIVDLKGRTLLPGFIDPHHHTVLSALFADLLLNIGYAKYPTRADALAALKAAAAKTPPGQWIAAGSFDNLLQGGDLSMKDLDAISTEHPIFVLYVNGHVGAANAEAFQLAKIARDVGELPGGGHFGRGPNGELNGLIYEQPALFRFLDIAIPAVTPELIAKALASYTRQAAVAGNTTVHEPGTIKPEWVHPLAKLSNTLDVRMSASLSTDSVEASKAFASLGSGAKARKAPRQPFFSLWHEILGGRLQPGRVGCANQALSAPRGKGQDQLSRIEDDGLVPRGEGRRLADPDPLPGRCGDRRRAGCDRIGLWGQPGYGAQRDPARDHGA